MIGYTESILCICVLVSMYLGVVFLLVLMVVQTEMDKRAKKEFLKTLDEHDCALILKYEQTRAYLFKKRK